MSNFSGCCAKCYHRKTCKIPCAPVDQHLDMDNNRPLERVMNDRVVVFPGHWRERRESSLVYDFNDNPMKKKVAYFSTEAESPFSRPMELKLKQSGVFMDHFFFGIPFKELAEKYDSSETSVAKLYENAVYRLHRMILSLDRVDAAKHNGQPVIKITNQVRVFLLHLAFGLKVGEIAKLLGKGPNQVTSTLKRVRDRLIAGEMELFTFSDEECRAARERLQKERDKLRDYKRDYARKRRERRRAI